MRAASTWFAQSPMPHGSTIFRLDLSVLWLADRFAAIGPRFVKDQESAMHFAAILLPMVFVATLPYLQEGAYAARGGKDKMEDGLYIWVAEGPGRRVTRNDGAEVVLVRRVSGGFGKATLRFLANDNSHFRLELKDAGPLAKGDVG